MKTFSEMLRAELRAAQENPEKTEEKLDILPAAQDEADMGRQWGLGSIAEPIDKNLPYPLVQVGLGGIAGLLVGELVDGFAMPKVGGRMNFANVIAKGAAVMVAAGPARQFLGNIGAMAFGTVLVVQVAADLLPVSEWATNLKKMLPTGGSTGGTAPARQPHPVTPGARDKIGSWFGK